MHDRAISMISNCTSNGVHTQSRGAHSKHRGAYSEQRCILRAERCILDTGILAIEGALRSGHAGSSLPCSRLSYIIEQQDPDDEDDDDNDDDAGNVDHNDAGNVDHT